MYKRCIKGVYKGCTPEVIHNAYTPHTRGKVEDEEEEGGEGTSNVGGKADVGSVVGKSVGENTFEREREGERERETE